jgi:DNA-binding XRE family transcriptional regulator
MFARVYKTLHFRYDYASFMKLTSEEDLLYKLVGEQIRKGRERQKPKMSQAQLAGFLGISRTSIVNIEAGRQHPPLYVMWKIAETLRIEISHFFPKPEEVTILLTSTAEMDEEFSGLDLKGQIAVQNWMQRIKSGSDNK